MEMLNIITITETIDDDICYCVCPGFWRRVLTIMLKTNFLIPLLPPEKKVPAYGLAISRFIIEDHQGKIWAENKPDGGAEFSFKLKVI